MKSSQYRTGGDRLWARALWPALVVACTCVLTMSVVAVAQDKGAKPYSFPGGEQEIRDEAHKFRFALPKGWTVQRENGVTYANSPDSKVLMASAILDSPKEIPMFLGSLDKLVVVTGTRFGEPVSTLQGLIPIQQMAGAGTLQPAGAPVELLSVTANVLEKPMVTMFFVHKDAIGTYMPQVNNVVKSFALLLTPQEAEAVQKALEAKTKKGGAGGRP